MNPDFPRVAILGAGLLGGSLAMALRRLPSPPDVRLWGRRPETVAQAREMGIESVTGDLGSALADANLVILTVPVGVMPALLSQAIEAGLPSGCLVTDVGSVKSPPHRTLPQLLEKTGAHFIGSHPMAGSEENGIASATPDLFAGSACLLTNDHRAPASLAIGLEKFWQSIGCRISWMGAMIHDELVARLSHLPHVLAATGARVCLKDPSEGRFAGGGLRDTTRVASGNPGMWTEILMENRSALVGPLHEVLLDLRELLDGLEAGDHEQVRRWLATAKRHRDHLNTFR